VTTLGPRALNRALLARQLLLGRDTRSVANVLDHLVGLQAQAPLAPYVALWSRLRGFDPTELSRAIAERRAVRTTLMRVTIHLVNARDALALRPFVQPVCEQVFASSGFARDVDGIALDGLRARARALVEERPRTRVELSRELAERFAHRDAASLAYAFTFLEPLVHVPPRGLWGESGPAALTTVASWLGRSPDPVASPEDIVIRYLAAFGPATVADVAKWSRVSGLRAVVERLRRRLRMFRDAAGRELFDVPGAPLPDPDTPAPPRFLPEYDNVLLSHADRTRIIPPRSPRLPLPAGNGARTGTFLVDGFLRGTWRLEDGELRIEPFTPLTRREAGALDDEAERLRAFLATQA
jgi:Winged helix DNA-binding domain